MGATPLGLRYPEATDRLTDGALAIQHLAEDVDAHLTDPQPWLDPFVQPAGSGYPIGAYLNGVSAVAGRELRFAERDGIVHLRGRIQIGASFAAGQALWAMRWDIAPSVSFRHTVAIIQNAPAGTGQIFIPTEAESSSTPGLIYVQGFGLAAGGWQYDIHLSWPTW